MASGKSLEPKERDELRRLLTHLVAESGGQAALAEDMTRKGFKVSQQMISNIINGVSEGGVHFANNVARFLGHQTYAEILGPNKTPKYGEDPSWQANEPAAVAQHPFPPGVVRLARETPAYIQRPPYTPQAIIATILWRWAMASEDEKIDADTERVKEEKEAGRQRRRFRRDPSPPSEPKVPPARRGA